MTVKELRERLADVPDDMAVTIMGYDDDWNSCFLQPIGCSIWKLVNSKRYFGIHYHPASKAPVEREGTQDAFVIY